MARTHARTYLDSVPHTHTPSHASLLTSLSLSPSLPLPHTYVRSTHSSRMYAHVPVCGRQCVVHRQRLFDASFRSHRYELYGTVLVSLLLDHRFDQSCPHIMTSFTPIGATPGANTEPWKERCGFPALLPAPSSGCRRCCVTDHLYLSSGGDRQRVRVATLTTTTSPPQPSMLALGFEVCLR